MEKVIKLPKETIDAITKLQQDYLQLTTQIGEIEVGIRNLQDAKENLVGEYKKLKTNEKTLLDEIGSKYGFGALNIQTGELVINVDENQPKQ